MKFKDDPFFKSETAQKVKLEAVCVLSSKEMSAGEISAMKNGKATDLPEPETCDVDLVVGGQKIGTGQITRKSTGWEVVVTELEGV